MSSRCKATLKSSPSNTIASKSVAYEHGRNSGFLLLLASPEHHGRSNAWPRGQNLSRTSLRGSLYDLHTFVHILIDIRRSDVPFKLHSAVVQICVRTNDMGAPSKVSLLSVLGHLHMRTAEAFAMSTEYRVRAGTNMGILFDLLPSPSV